jgi:hypothetical protein
MSHRNPLFLCARVLIVRDDFNPQLVLPANTIAFSRPRVSAAFICQLFLRYFYFLAID